MRIADMRLLAVRKANRKPYPSFWMVQFRMTLSGLERLNEIFSDMKHRAVSLRQLNFLFSYCSWKLKRCQASGPKKSTSSNNSQFSLELETFGIPLTSKLSESVVLERNVHLERVMCSVARGYCSSLICPKINCEVYGKHSDSRSDNASIYTLGDIRHDWGRRANCRLGG